jgi:hypothetical protein
VIVHVAQQVERGAREQLPGAVPQAGGEVRAESPRQSNEDALASLMNSRTSAASTRRTRTSRAR